MSVRRRRSFGDCWFDGTIGELLRWAGWSLRFGYGLGRCCRRAPAPGTGEAVVGLLLWVPALLVVGFLLRVRARPSSGSCLGSGPFEWRACGCGVVDPGSSRRFDLLFVVVILFIYV